MPNRTCPTCLKRLPYAGRRCRHCGWKVQAGVDHSAGREARRRRQLIVAGVLVLFLVATAGVMARNAEGIADWYAGFAAEHLAQPFSAFAPTDTDLGAYFYCARLVSRQMDGDFSVETFPDPGDHTTLALGERRYRVVSFVEQARDDGERVRHDFSCTVRYDHGRWVLEKLDLARFAGGTVTAQGGAWQME